MYFIFQYVNKDAGVTAAVYTYMLEKGKYISDLKVYY